jgi:hypothetical protein
MKLNARIGRLFILGALALASPGCAYFASYPVLQSASPDEFVSVDLPVPEGFEIASQDSWRHERSTYRRYKLIYQREDYLRHERVQEFVHAAYTRAGWDLEFQYGFEEVKLLFTKGSEECLVSIKEDFGDRSTQFVVEVQPRTTPDGGLVGRDDAWRTDAASEDPEAPVVEPVALAEE